MEPRVRIMVGGVLLGILLQVCVWPAQWVARGNRRSTDQAPPEAVRRLIARLPPDPGAIYIDRPSAMLYYYASYYAFPRRVLVTDKPVPINTEQDIAREAVDFTPEIGHRLGVSCFMEVVGDELKVYRVP